MQMAQTEAVSAISTLGMAAIETSGAESGLGCEDGRSGGFWAGKKGVRERGEMESRGRRESKRRQ